MSGYPLRLRPHAYTHIAQPAPMAAYSGTICAVAAQSQPRYRPMTTATSQSALRSGAPPCALPPKLRPKPDAPGLDSPPKRQPEQTWRRGGSAQPSAELPTRPPSEKAAETNGARTAQRGVRPPKPGWEGLGHSPPCRTTRRAAWPSAGGATCCSSMCERYAWLLSPDRQKVPQQNFHRRTRSRLSPSSWPPLRSPRRIRHDDALRPLALGAAHDG